jgi:hypothetical protein
MLAKKLEKRFAVTKKKNLKLRDALCDDTALKILFVFFSHKVELSRGKLRLDVIPSMPRLCI